jgi:hypothetical protein
MSPITDPAVSHPPTSALRRGGRAVAVAALVAAMTLLVAGPAQADLSVRARWDMGSLPTMVDKAGGDNDGKTHNITKNGSGNYHFNGHSSVATVPDKGNLDPGSATIKLTARVRFTDRPAVGDTHDLIRKGFNTSGGGDYKMEILGRSKHVAVAACTFKDNKGVVAHAYGTIDLADGDWTTITCRKSGSGVQVSAAGENRKTSKSLGSISNSAPLHVGAKGDGTDWFEGDMDFAMVEIG